MQAVLDRRAAAVVAADPRRWADTLDGSDAAFRAEQEALFDRLRLVGPTLWRYELLGPVTADESQGAAAPSAPSSEGIRAQVRLHLRLPGDTRDLTRDQTVRLVQSGNGYAISAVSSVPGSARDLWDLGPVDVAVGSRSLVVLGRTGTGNGTGNGNGTGTGPGTANALAAEVDAAAQDVDAVWGTGWPRRVVVLAPATDADARAVLGPAADGLGRLAALTTGAVQPGDGRRRVPDGTADRVVLSPDVFDRLTPTGRLVVLRHELTHVATRSRSGLTPPLWLQEGFASWVGYRGSGLPDATVAADTLDAVRSGSLPTGLPADAAFDAGSASGDGVAAAYAQAWVACDEIARTVGQQGLVRFYRTAAVDGEPGTTAPSASADGALAAAFADVLRESPDAFTARWRERLRALARTAA